MPSDAFAVKNRSAHCPKISRSAVRSIPFCSCNFACNAFSSASFCVEPYTVLYLRFPSIMPRYSKRHKKMHL